MKTEWWGLFDLLMVVSIFFCFPFHFSDDTSRKRHPNWLDDMIVIIKKQQSY